MRYGELFAGAGGLSLGLDRAGMECAFHAEIEEFPRRILRRHWPDVPLFGDVARLNGAELVAQCGPIDLLSGGSPCQDLSMAGKRRGLGANPSEGVDEDRGRSNLFYEQVRLWEETGASLCLWENVCGALSSNDGKDFSAVLSAFVGGAVFVPTDGWRSAGVVAGSTGVAAWRIIDARFFGVPQRRRRVFVLGSRAGGLDPSEILLERESLRGYSAKSRTTRERNSASAGEGAENTGGYGVWDAATGGGRGGGAVPTLCGGHQSGISDTTVIVAAISEGFNGDVKLTNVVPTLQTQGGKPGQGYSAIITLPADESTAVTSESLDGSVKLEDVVPCLQTTGRGKASTAVLSFHTTQTPVSGEISPTLGGTSSGMEVMAYNETGFEKWTEEPIAGALCAANSALTLIADDPPLVPCVSVGSPGGMSGQDIVGTADAVLRAELQREGEVVGTLDARHAGGFQSVQSAAAGHLQATKGVPRRLTPLECERLMSWDDGWTNPQDGKPAADSRRYKACGNGVVSNCVEWIARRILKVEAITDAPQANTVDSGHERARTSAEDQ